MGLPFRSRDDNPLMEITENALDEFIALWEATYVTPINREQALNYARQLLQLTIAVYGPR